LICFSISERRPPVKEGRKMKNKLMYIPVFGFLLLGVWVSSMGYLEGGATLSPEGKILCGIELMLFAFILFIAYVVIFENKKKKT
jgi:hypothetical protein